MTAIIVIGAGGHAKVVIEAIRAARGFEIIGVVDPKPPTANDLLGVPWLGGDEVLGRLRTESTRRAFVALGNNRLRQQIGEHLSILGFELPPIIHPTAQVSPSASIGRGCIIMARACVGPVSTIGDMSIINTGAIVEHDNVIGRAAHVAPGAALGGSVTIGDRSLVGVGAAIRPDIVLGDDVIVGAGSGVVDNFPSGVMIGGVPARRLPTSL